LFDLVFLTEFSLKTGYNFIAYSVPTIFQKGTFIVLTSHLVNQNYKIAAEPTDLYSDFNFNFFQFDYKQYQNNFVQHVGEPITSYKLFSLFPLSPFRKYRFIFNVLLKTPIDFNKLEIGFKKKYSISGSYYLSITKINSAPKFRELIKISGSSLNLIALF